MLAERYPHKKIAIVGYSMGGNVLLKWLGETREHYNLHTGIAISVFSFTITSILSLASLANLMLIY